MATKRFPVISRQDYPAFRAMPDMHIPDTYDEWLQIQNEEVRDWTAGGHEAIRVDIDPNEFSAFCRANGARKDLDALRRFAWRDT